MNQYHIIYLSRFVLSHIQWSRLHCVGTFSVCLCDCALFVMWKIEQQSDMHVEWARLKLFKNWIFNSWVIWEYFNWAKARQSCLYLMGFFPRCDVLRARACRQALATMQSMYHVRMIAYLIEFNEHLVNLCACACVCMRELFEFFFSRSLALPFRWPNCIFSLRCHCIVSIIRFLRECGFWMWCCHRFDCTKRELNTNLSLLRDT